MEIAITITLAAVILAFIIAITVIQDWDDRQQIVKHLTKSGASKIVVSTLWLDGDRSNGTYAVDYEDAQGQSRKNECKVSSGLLDDKTIYWRDPL